MKLAEFKNDIYKVDQVFFNNFNDWLDLPQDEQEKIISKYPIHIKNGVKVITDREFALLETKNWMK